MPVPASSSPAASTTTNWVKETSEWLLDCECSTPKVLLSLLQSLSDCQHTTFYCSPTAGLTIHTHPNPQFQCTLELPVGLFSKFHAQECDFCVSYKALLDCLAVLTIENPLQLSLRYHGPSEVLKLEATLRQGVSSAAISGMVPPEASAELSAAFGASPVIARLLCSSKDLQDWAELDTVAGVASIELWFQPQAITASVVGHSSQCEVVLPLPVDAQKTKVHYSYPFQAWRRAIKPLEVAKETCLSINANGILAIQHQMVHEDTAAFCDSLVLPLVTEEEERADRNSQDDPDDEEEEEATSSTLDAHTSHRHDLPLSSQGTSISRSMTTRQRLHLPDDSSTIPSVVTQRHSQKQRQQQQQPLHPNQNMNKNYDNDDSETDDGDDNHDNDSEQLQNQSRPLLFGTATGGAAAAGPLSSATSSLSLTPATTASTYPPSIHRRSRKRLTPRSNHQDQKHLDSEDEEEEHAMKNDSTHMNPSREDGPRRRRRKQSSTSDSSASHESSSPPPTRRFLPQPGRPKSPSQESYSEILYCSSPEVVYGGD